MVVTFALTVTDRELYVEYNTLSAARFKFDSHDYVGAIALYDRSIELDDSNALALFKRGKCYQFLGDHRRAIQDYNQSLFIDRKRAGVYYILGLLHDVVGRRALAVFNYTRAIDLNPNHAEALVSRAFAYNRSYGFTLVLKDLKVALGLFVAQGNYDRAKDTIDSIALFTNFSKPNVVESNTIVIQ